MAGEDGLYFDGRYWQPVNGERLWNSFHLALYLLVIKKAEEAYIHLWEHGGPAVG